MGLHGAQPLSDPSTPAVPVAVARLHFADATDVRSCKTIVISWVAMRLLQLHMCMADIPCSFFSPLEFQFSEQNMSSELITGPTKHLPDKVSVVFISLFVGRKKKKIFTSIHVQKCDRWGFSLAQDVKKSRGLAWGDP